MLNSIDSFFQYFVKRAFNLFCFSAKRMPYRMLICKCCFLSCCYIVISTRCECRRWHGLKFAYIAVNGFSKEFY